MREPDFLGKKILVITAHPDDESYCAAGTIYKNYEAGGKTFLVCATLGEKGTSHLKKPLPERKVKNLRKIELTRAARFLHISKTFLLDLPDGKVLQKRRKMYLLVKIIAKKIKPDVIISFGKDGISGHLDHISAGMVARKLSQLLGISLYTFGLPPRFLKKAKTWLLARRRAPHYMKGHSLKFTRPKIRIKIDSRIKRKSLNFYFSQMDERNPFAGFPDYAVREYLANEYFTYE